MIKNKPHTCHGMMSLMLSNTSVPSMAKCHITKPAHVSLLSVEGTAKLPDSVAIKLSAQTFGVAKHQRRESVTEQITENQKDVNRLTKEFVLFLLQAIVFTIKYVWPIIFIIREWYNTLSHKSITAFLTLFRTLLKYISQSIFHECSQFFAAPGKPYFTKYMWRDLQRSCEARGKQDNRQD